jgi:hypothetical protein
VDASLAPYHQHHQELLRLAREHESRLAPALVRSHPDLCLAASQRLVASAKAYLSMENAVLFPALLEAVDTDIQAAARGLEAGLGDLKMRLRQFNHHWTHPETIRQVPEAFIEASQDLLRTLRQRIDLEEARLFPLVERA